MTTKSKLTLLLAAVTGFGVIGYNLWSYSCGHCTLHSLMTLGPAGFLLLGVNLALFGLWLALKFRRQRALQGTLCRCGAPQDATWQYCPACGEEGRS